MNEPFYIFRDDEVTWATNRAREIARLHRNHGSSRPLSAGYELRGVFGELAFYRITGLEMDLRLLPSGDGRTDFEPGNGVGTIDVKAANKAYNLLRECDKLHADILVLAQVHEDPVIVEFLGWEYDAEMVTCPVKQFHDDGPMNHYKHRSQLRHMPELLAMLGVA